MSSRSYAFGSAIAVGSSIRMSSANDSRLPLCGVALVSRSASVRGAKSRARRFRNAERFATLWHSSMTTASQWIRSRWCPYCPGFFSVSIETITRL